MSAKRSTKPSPESPYVRAICPWCDRYATIGSLVHGNRVISPTLCGHCHHRADVTRDACDCADCTRLRQLSEIQRAVWQILTAGIEKPTAREAIDCFLVAFALNLRGQWEWLDEKAGIWHLIGGTEWFRCRINPEIAGHWMIEMLPERAAKGGGS